MWWEAYMSYIHDLDLDLDLDQLQAYKATLLKLRENVLERIQQLQHPDV